VPLPHLVHAGFTVFGVGVAASIRRVGVDASGKRDGIGPLGGGTLAGDESAGLALAVSLWESCRVFVDFAVKGALSDKYAPDSEQISIEAA
jgi:hypothetical protein